MGQSSRRPGQIQTDSPVERLLYFCQWSSVVSVACQYSGTMRRSSSRRWIRYWAVLTRFWWS
jgi:hypothetical protein